MNDHYLAEKLLNRIYHETFGDKDFEDLKHIDRSLLAGMLVPLMRNNITYEQLLQYVTYKWQFEFKLFVNEMITNAQQNMSKFCTVETLCVCGLPGSGIDFVARYLHNFANPNSKPLKLSAQPVDSGEHYDIYEIQKLINTSEPNIAGIYELIEQLKQKHNMRMPVFAVNVWNKQTMNLFGYMKDVSIVKMLPETKHGKYFASKLSHTVLETVMAKSRRNINSVDTGQGTFKNTLLNKWHSKNNHHDETLLTNSANNTYTDWYSFDTFHPTFPLSLDNMANNQMAAEAQFEMVLQEVPDTDKEARRKCLQQFYTQWEDAVNV